MINNSRFEQLVLESISSDEHRTHSFDSFSTNKTPTTGSLKAKNIGDSLAKRGYVHSYSQTHENGNITHTFTHSTKPSVDVIDHKETYGNSSGNISWKVKDGRHGGFNTKTNQQIHAIPHTSSYNSKKGLDHAINNPRTPDEHDDAISRGSANITHRLQESIGDVQHSISDEHGNSSVSKIMSDVHDKLNRMGYTRVGHDRGIMQMHYYEHPSNPALTVGHYDGTKDPHITIHNQKKHPRNSSGRVIPTDDTPNSQYLSGSEFLGS